MRSEKSGDGRRAPSPLNGEKVVEGRMRGGHTKGSGSHRRLAKFMGVITPHPGPLPVEGRGRTQRLSDLLYVCQGLSRFRRKQRVAHPLRAFQTLRMANVGTDLYTPRNNRIQQSVVPWCFNPMPPREVVEMAARLKMPSVELIAPEHWPLLKEKGMTCAIASSHGFSKGFAHVEEHQQCLDNLRKNIDLASNAAVPSIITFSGFRRGLAMEEGKRNMIDGLKKIAAHAEEKKVTVCLEML